MKSCWRADPSAMRGLEMEAVAPRFYKADLPCFAIFRTEGGLELTPAARDRVLARCLEEHGTRYALFAVG